MGKGEEEAGSTASVQPGGGGGSLSFVSLSLVILWFNTTRRTNDDEAMVTMADKLQIEEITKNG